MQTLVAYTTKYSEYDFPLNNPAVFYLSAIWQGLIISGVLLLFL